MAKRTRRPIRGIGPMFADALQVPPHVREAAGSEFVAAPTKRRRAASKRATTSGSIGIIALGGSFDKDEFAAVMASFRMGAPSVSLHLVEGGPDYPEANEGIMALSHDSFGAGLDEALDISSDGPATEAEMAGLLRTLARGRNEPDDMSGVLRTLARGR